MCLVHQFVILRDSSHKWPIVRISVHLLYSPRSTLSVHKDVPHWSTLYTMPTAFLQNIVLCMWHGMQDLVAFTRTTYLLHTFSGFESVAPITPYRIFFPPQILLENWTGRTGNSKISSCSSANQQGNMVFWVSPPKRTKTKFQDASPVWTANDLKGSADHPDPESNIVGSRLTPNRNTTKHYWASSGHWFFCAWDRSCKCRSRSQPFNRLNLCDSDWTEADEADRPDWGDRADRAKGPADWVCWTHWTSTGELPTLAALACLTKWG